MTHTTSIINKISTYTINDHVVEMILINIPSLSCDGVYLAEDLIGSDIWGGMDKGMRICIGKTIYALTEDGLLPLVYVEKTKCNKHTYRLN